MRIGNKDIFFAINLFNNYKEAERLWIAMKEQFRKTSPDFAQEIQFLIEAAGEERIKTEIIDRGQQISQDEANALFLDETNKVSSVLFLTFAVFYSANEYFLPDIGKTRINKIKEKYKTELPDLIPRLERLNKNFKIFFSRSLHDFLLKPYSTFILFLIIIVMLDKLADEEKIIEEIAKIRRDWREKQK